MTMYIFFPLQFLVQMATLQSHAGNVGWSQPTGYHESFCRRRQRWIARTLIRNHAITSQWILNQTRNLAVLALHEYRSQKPNAGVANCFWIVEIDMKKFIPVVELWALNVTLWYELPGLKTLLNGKRNGEKIFSPRLPSFSIFFFVEREVSSITNTGLSIKLQIVKISSMQKNIVTFEFW